MLGNLKIAVKRQKKLIIIFLMTIFLPSIALSVFGVRSIRNERFRLVKQLEDEHKRAADFLKNQISSRFADIEIILQNLAQHPSFNHKDYASIEESLNNQLKGDHLIEHVFLAYKDEEPLFPLFLPVLDKRASTALFPLESAQREKLERAQSFEFRQKKFLRGSCSIPTNLFSLQEHKYPSTDAQQSHHFDSLMSSRAKRGGEAIPPIVIANAVKQSHGIVSH